MSTPNLKDQRILLGVCAGIAAYKAPILVRALRAMGAEVQVVLSQNAHQFVSPTSLQAVSGHPVRQDLWDESAEAAMGHIELARWASMVVVAPATANTMAKLAQGMADDLLTTLCLATAAPVILAPAMNQQMYQHPASEGNRDKLAALGFDLLGPDSGDQACGETGPGRMVEPEAIAAYVANQASQAPRLETASSGCLAGQTVMITTGPTVEAIDPVRYISNHSSGLQGISLANAALAQGAKVKLIAGPKVPATAAAIERIDVVTALDMQEAVHTHMDGVSLFIGVAAVSDYRPAEAAPQKMKRSGKDDSTLEIKLVENPDIIAGVAKAFPHLVMIGFAAETNDTHKHAREKLARKGLSAIVVNDVSDPTIGFNSQNNAAALIHEHGEVSFPKQSKQALAEGLIAEIGQIFASQLADTNPESVTK